jgi:hypothetical protein
VLYVNMLCSVTLGIVLALGEQETTIGPCDEGTGLDRSDHHTFSARCL